jgi:putative ABC transport system permease protein
MWRAGLSALLSHWLKHPMQLAMLLMGLAAATALWTGVQAINSEARASYARAAGQLDGGGERLVRRDGGRVALSDYVALRRAGWNVSPAITGEMSFGSVRVRLLGVDPLTLPRGEEMGIDAAGDIAAFLTWPGEMMVSEALARRLKEARLEGQGAPRLRIVENAPSDLAVVDIGVAARLLDFPDGELSWLSLSDQQPEGLAPLEQLVPELERRTPASGADLARLTDSFHLNLTAFGLLAFVVGLFIVYSTIGLAFEQRRPVFRTLRALGIPSRMLVLMMLVELTGLALIAGIAGVLAGYAVALALMPDVAATLRGLYGARVTDGLSLRPSWWLAGLGIAVAGTLVSALESLWRAGRLPLLAAAQPRAWARLSEVALRWQGGAAVTLLAAGGALYVFGDGLVMGFAVLGAVLMAAALALPLLLSFALAVCQRMARGPVAQWFWADTRQQLPGLSLSLMSLLLALATNVGVSTMVGSFRHTFMGYLDQRLASELYIQARGNDEAARMAAWLDGRVDAVLPMWSVMGEVGGARAEIFGAVDHPTYRDNWPLIEAAPDAWGRLAAGEGALINEQMARRDGLGPGDRVALPGGWSPVIAGVYSDYGNTSGQVIIGQGAMEAHYPNASRSRLAVRVAPERVAALSAELVEAFDLPASMLIDQAGLKAMSVTIFERTFAVTGALNVLTLSVAGLALFASLMTLSGMRLPQLAPVWAMGLTRGRLAVLEMARTIALATLTGAAAIPVGIAMAWVLLSLVNVEAFGWLLPMRLFPLDWLALGALALLAAFLAGIIPARRLARLAPADLLRVFAHER